MHLKVARPPILRVVKTIVPLDGATISLHRVSLQDGGSGAQFPLVSHRRLSNPARKILRNKYKEYQ